MSLPAVKTTSPAAGKPVPKPSPSRPGLPPAKGTKSPSRLLQKKKGSPKPNSPKAKGSGKTKKAIKTDEAAMALADILVKVELFAAAAEPKPSISGEVFLRYNHYKEPHTVTHDEGSSATISQADVVELLSLDYAFNGTFIVHLNPLQSCPSMKRMWQDKEGLIGGLVVGKEYWVDVVEDAVAEAQVERKTYNPDKKADDNAPREEGCSCLFGNPCMESYTCADWQNRFDVAKKNGWKGHS